MKAKRYIIAGFIALGAGIAASSCSKDEASGSTMTSDQAQNYEYNASDSAAWGNYAANVALLLKEDADNLYEKWANEYAGGFKNASRSVTGFSSHKACVEQIFSGCADIANEVSSQKIGDPYNKYKSGKTTEALYAVESWYSFHSRDDYKNNIVSIANSLMGVRLGDTKPENFDVSTAAANAIYTVGVNDSELSAAMTDLWNKTIAAWNAIDAIPQPFRNNIGNAKATVAIDACAALDNALTNLKTKFTAKITDEQAKDITATYVDNVVLPTYASLQYGNAKLYKVVLAFQQNPTQANCDAACEEWLAARAPWEMSEAFLFGPVSELGLDPNMDSWPLDAISIVNLLKSQQWSQMQWDGSFEESKDGEENPRAEAISAAQSVRGYHTLEYLLFKNGYPRKMLK